MLNKLGMCFKAENRQERSNLVRQGMNQNRDVALKTENRKYGLRGARQ